MGEGVKLTRFQVTCSKQFTQLSISNQTKIINLQATKLFIVTPTTKGGGYHPPRFRVRFQILYRVIQVLIQHCLLRRMVYLSIIYVIATRNYEFLLAPLFRN